MANIAIIGSEVHLWLGEAAFRFLSEQEPRHWVVSFSAPPITSSKQSDRKMTFLVGHLQTGWMAPGRMMDSHRPRGREHHLSCPCALSIPFILLSCPPPPVMFGLKAL